MDVRSGNAECPSAARGSAQSVPRFTSGTFTWTFEAAGSRIAQKSGFSATGM
jgi:hypothetical protein